MIKHQDQSGFTILELMIATTLFTVILLLCTAGLIRIGSIYYKGVVTSRTQSVARTISDDITQAIQYGGQDIQSTAPPLVNYNGGSSMVDIGDRRYEYVLGRVLVDGTPSALQTSYAMRSTTIDGNHNVVAGQTPRELMNTNMWLSRLDVSNNGGVYQVRVQVVSGDQDLIEDQDGNDFGQAGFDINSLRCKAETGNEFCAVSGLYTEVVRRL